MSSAGTTTQPVSIAADSATRSGRLLSLVRRLIDYGRELAASLRADGRATDLSRITRAFGSTDLAFILSRIVRGLHRAQALEARLIETAPRLDAGPRHVGAASQRSPRTPVPTDAPAGIVRLPTPENIAAEARRRPIGAVIADICRDLGILPSHPLWRDVQRAIIEHGGNLAALVKDTCDRLFRLTIRGWPPAAPDLATPPPPLGQPASSTGPP